MINILEPDLTKKEISLVNNTLKKKHISSFGNLPILVKKKYHQCRVVIMLR